MEVWKERKRGLRPGVKGCLYRFTEPGKPVTGIEWDITSTSDSE